jgi:hypothetical protein
MRKLLILILAPLGALSLNGCVYYEITDPESGKTYYTNCMLIGRHAGSGALRFTDLTTGKEVTLQNSEIRAISQEKATLSSGSY